MRRLLLTGTAALALTAGTAGAGGLAEPAMEPEVVAERTSSSSGGIIVPLLLLILVAVAISGGDDSGEELVETSDARLKTDLAWQGMRGGVSVWQWRYRDRPGRYEGVLAQEMLALRPAAVTFRGDGMLAVRYAGLPVAFRQVH